jgi:hypothetical protein
MVRLENFAKAIALLCALAGTGLIVLFVFGQGPRASLTTEAAVAAAMSIVLLLLSVLVAQPFAAGWFGRSRAHRSRRCGQCNSETVCSARKRREVLESRLHIDSPRVCSQHVIVCTCWSLCGSVPPEEKIFGRDTRSEAGMLLSVRREGKDDCPFRFSASR